MSTNLWLSTIGLRSSLRPSRLGYVLVHLVGSERFHFLFFFFCVFVFV